MKLTLDTNDTIFFYEQDFYVFSNFSSFRVKWKNLDFDTSEAAYHWEKFIEVPSIQHDIRKARSAHEAFKLAGEYKRFQRADWDSVKFDIMKQILIEKVKQHEYVKHKLISSGSKKLVENSWRDPIWGWGEDQQGQNMLGKIWMEVRDYINFLEKG